MGSNPTLSASIVKKAPSRGLFFCLSHWRKDDIAVQVCPTQNDPSQRWSGGRSGGSIRRGQPGSAAGIEFWFGVCQPGGVREAIQFGHEDRTDLIMPLKLNKLTSLGVVRLKTAGYYGDGGGLILQVSTTGAKSWLFRYKRAGRIRELGLGSLRTIDLAGARATAKRFRTMLEEDQDPLDERRLAKTSAALERGRQMTFDQCAAAYIDSHRDSWKNAKHAEQWVSTLATYASPLIGPLPVAAVDTDLVVKVLSRIWKTKTETATRLRGRIECVLDWATVSKFRVGENPARWKGHLENLLASPNKSKRDIYPTADGRLAVGIMIQRQRS